MGVGGGGGAAQPRAPPPAWLLSRAPACPARFLQPAAALLCAWTRPASLGLQSPSRGPDPLQPRTLHPLQARPERCPVSCQVSLRPRGGAAGDGGAGAPRPSGRTGAGAPRAASSCAQLPGVRAPAALRPELQGCGMWLPPRTPILRAARLPV